MDQHSQRLDGKAVYHRSRNACTTALRRPYSLPGFRQSKVCHISSSCTFRAPFSAHVFLKPVSPSIPTMCPTSCAPRAYFTLTTTHAGSHASYPRLGGKSRPALQTHRPRRLTTTHHTGVCVYVAVLYLLCREIESRAYIKTHRDCGGHWPVETIILFDYARC